MRDFLRGCRAALTFLTVVPVGGHPYSDSTLRWSAAWFPLVGVLVGLAGAGVFLLLRPAGLGIASVAAVATTALLTGALHEDGLADTADALGGAYDRHKLFEILKDSRVGTFGALALVMSVAFRVAALVALDEQAPLAILLTHVLARTSPTWLMASIPYVTDPDSSKSQSVVRITAIQALVGTGMAGALLIGLWLSSWLAWSTVLAMMGLLVLIALVAALVFNRRAGGITGDFLGATEQCNEIALLVLLAGLGLP